MKKSININISGIVFQIDDDAFEKLRSYLQEVNVRFRQVPGGHEALDDFEARVAEIFQNSRGVTGIVTMEDVDEMITIMGRPEEIVDDYEGELQVDFRTSARRRLYRDPDETIIAGVAGGIGSYLNADPVWFRLLFILTTVFYGFGFFIYIALWVTLPVASTEARKRELYGLRYNQSVQGRRRGRGRTGSETVDRVGGVLNEIFRAVGRFLIILFRVVVIIIGTLLVLSGVALLVLIISALIFNYGPWLPGALFTDTFHFTDLFSVLITPVAVPWVIALSIIVLALPLLGLVYWGIKMIFRFRARDGVVSIISLVLWVIAAVALTMVLFSQGISFAKSSSVTLSGTIKTSDQSFVITAGNVMSPDHYDKKIQFPFDETFWIYTTGSGEVCCSPLVYIRHTDKEAPYAEVKRHGNGHTVEAAWDNAGKISYDWKISNDTLALDAYFPVPGKTRWNGSMVKVHIFVPDGFRIFIDESIEPFISYPEGRRRYPWDSGGRWWVMTDDGLVTD